MSAYKLSNDFEVPLSEAENFIKDFYRSYPKLEDYFEQQYHLAYHRGYVLIDPVI